MSKQKRYRYTAQEMREMADCISNIKQSEMPLWKEGEIITGGDLCRSAEMLHQAADAEEELVQLKVRLEAATKECEKSKWDPDNWLSSTSDATCAHNRYIDRILRAARGESENENK